MVCKLVRWKAYVTVTDAFGFIMRFKRKLLMFCIRMLAAAKCVV